MTRAISSTMAPRAIKYAAAPIGQKNISSIWSPRRNIANRAEKAVQRNKRPRCEPGQAAIMQAAIDRVQVNARNGVISGAFNRFTVRK